MLGQSADVLLRPMVDAPCPAALPELPSDVIAHVLFSLIADAAPAEAIQLVRASQISWQWRRLLLAPFLWRRALAERWPATAGVVTSDYRRLFVKMLRKDERERSGTDLRALQVFLTIRQGTLAELLCRRSCSAAETLLAQTLAGDDSTPVAHRLDSTGEDWRPVRRSDRSTYFFSSAPPLPSASGGHARLLLDFSARLRLASSGTGCA